MKGEQPPNRAAIEAWWAAVLAGRVDEPHPVLGDDLKLGIKHGVLHLSGSLDSEEERKELLADADAYVGRGIDRVDSKHLKVLVRTDKPGILDQTLIAAFPNRHVADLARQYIVDARRVKPKQLEILESGNEDRISSVVPDEFAGDVQEMLKAGAAVLVVRVDEIEAFKVRELLAEDTRSIRTVATPPTLAARGRR